MKDQSPYSLSDPAGLRDFLNLLARGDDKAFNVFYLKWRNRMYRFARAKGLSDHDAQEAADETVLAFCRQVKTLFGEGQTEASIETIDRYMFGIARNKCADHYRRIWDDKKNEVSDTDDQVANVADDDSMDVVKLMETAQDSEAIHHCLGKLSSEHREAVTLAYWAEYNQSAISEWQGVPLGTVKSRLSNAKAQLAICFKNWINGGRYGR